MTIVLDCFLRVYCMLTNYVEFLESRGFEHNRFCRKLPLQGALKISSKLTPSDLNTHFRFRRTEAASDRPGLFVEGFSNTCRKSIDLSINIANNIEAAAKHLANSLVKTYSTHTVPVLFALVNFPDVPPSKTLKILSRILSESANDLTRRGKLLEELPAHNQTKTLLNLVSNFIRERGERPSRAHNHLKICKFCDSVVCEKKTQRNVNKFCCAKAERFNRLSNEWILLHVSQNPSFSRFVDSIENVKYDGDCDNKSFSRERDLATIGNSNDTVTQSMSTDKKNTSTLENRRYGNRASSQIKTNPKRRGDRKVDSNSNSVESQSLFTNKEDTLAFEDHYRNGIVSQRKTVNNDNRDVNRVTSRHFEISEKRSDT
ncbi:uncharacterized protein LOC109854628 [Pseudomyrmex gracilis]|uniref:uncharacterized protein LOC109854628 n=1 Tax=Pseudomyrmex gracilis TaxID=219809 RepID=UPI000994AC71|nr:uncharacterized protein LOC109854628 [Pseudomyrmex gracilis]